MAATEPNWTCLLPAVVAIVTAVLSRRPIESLLAGVGAGLVLLGPGEALGNFSAILLAVMMDETIAWPLVGCWPRGPTVAAAP